MPDLIDGRYQLLEVLASGGMATVWRAHDARLDRLVALKRPHPAPPGDPLHARIEREARAAASLNHPNLVTIYDVGRDDHGPYLVMELVEGPTLAEVGPDMDRPEAVEVVARVADALGAVHAAGIVHRDVKPANVLMSPRGPQLTDFGIAVEGDATTRLTVDGSLIATPSYASPEQLAGEPATARSDIFSLGVVLYELTAGRLPFSGTERAVTPEAIGDPHLDAVLARALSPDPAMRPGAEEFAASLISAAPTVTTLPRSGDTIQMPVSTAPPAPASAPGAPPRRPLVLAGVAVVSALALLALLLGLPGEESPAADTPPPTPAPSPTTATTLPTTTTMPPSTTVPTTSTVAEGDGEVAQARADLEAALSSVHPSEMNPREVHDMLKKADDAIRAAGEGKEKEAGKKLREIALTIDDKLDGEERRQALESLVSLADALGISLEDEGRGRDKDDDDEDDD